MTREEAIKRLKDGAPFSELLDVEWEKAVNMAIEALHQPKIKLTNHDWIDFLCEQFDISRTSAKEMLHVMMSVKREDNFKKQFRV